MNTILAATSGIPETIETLQHYKDIPSNIGFIVLIAGIVITIISIPIAIFKYDRDPFVTAIYGTAASIFLAITTLMVMSIPYHNTYDNTVDELENIIIENVQENIAFSEVKVLSRNIHDDGYNVRLQGITEDHSAIALEMTYHDTLDIMLPVEEYNASNDLPIIEGSQLDGLSQ